MSIGYIRRNVEDILKEIPSHVKLVAAAKTRSPEEVLEVISCGIKAIGENYVQDTVKAFEVIKHSAEWHFIGHLQKNKIKKAVEIFDVIETVDSIELAGNIQEKCCQINKIMKVFIEINSGREPQKFGVFPENAVELIKAISKLNYVKVEGLMTMGPYSGDPETARPYFSETKKLFDEIKTKSLRNVDMKYLSMGMTNSYKVAISEGANIVRIGTKIFGERK
ncbi:MAG: YggS family pyridoxal phosphate-dependent enzyme [Candidatus Omnitrophota bacterium]|nr:YggS family pyridoxal phosphate-dependent enzyme [Candidatus Omnitrophota bacterium]MBU1894680.1 YggS family pyridoxal phosphate-dependent enzyme [Candidatus Omnitrophota bacterium]